MVMLIPDDFNKICRNFHQDVHLEFSSPEEMIRSAADELDGKQSNAVKSFLDELLSGRYDDDELQKMWFNTAADIYFPEPGELRAFLKRMRELLD
jgi:hypothetical protein